MLIKLFEFINYHLKILEKHNKPFFFHFSKITQSLFLYFYYVNFIILNQKVQVDYLGHIRE